MIDEVEIIIKRVRRKCQVMILDANANGTSKHDAEEIYALMDILEVKLREVLDVKSERDDTNNC